MLFVSAIRIRQQIVGPEVHFCFSLPCVSWSGQYVFDVMDTYGGGLGVLWVAIFETAVIMWIYGVGKFAEDLCFMLNLKVRSGSGLQYILVYAFCKINGPSLGSSTGNDRYSGKNGQGFLFH